MNNLPRERAPVKRSSAATQHIICPATNNCATIGSDASHRHRRRATGWKRPEASRHSLCRARAPTASLGWRAESPPDLRGGSPMSPFACPQSQTVTYLFSRPNHDLLEMFAWSNVLLAFDYDGTLAPLVNAPAHATMRASTRRLLRRASKLYPVRRDHRSSKGRCARPAS